MSSLGRNLEHFKTLLNQGSELLLLRLRILALELNAQAGNAVKVIAVIIFAAVLLLVCLISLLFGLNSILEPQARIWFFFGFAAVLFFIVIGLLFWCISSWKNQGGQLLGTLQDMQQDFAYLRGRMGRNSVSKDKE